MDCRQDRLVHFFPFSLFHRFAVIESERAVLVVAAAAATVGAFVVGFFSGLAVHSISICFINLKHVM